MLMAEEAAVLQHVGLITAATLMLCLDQIWWFTGGLSRAMSRND